jgi:hypothetical protein
MAMGKALDGAYGEIRADNEHAIRAMALDGVPCARIARRWGLSERHVQRLAQSELDFRRAVLEWYVTECGGRRGETARGIHDRLSAGIGDDAPSYDTVRRILKDGMGEKEHRIVAESGLEWWDGESPVYGFLDEQVLWFLAPEKANPTRLYT